MTCLGRCQAHGTLSTDTKPAEILVHDLTLYLVENLGPLFLDCLADLLTISRLSLPNVN